MNLHPPKTSVFYKNKLIADIYNYTSISFPYIQIKNNYNVTTKLILLQLYYATIMTTYRLSNNEQAKNIRTTTNTLISQLESKLKFPDELKLQLNTLGTYVNPDREMKIMKWDKKFKDKNYYYTYKPELMVLNKNKN